MSAQKNTILTHNKRILNPTVLAEPAEPKKIHLIIMEPILIKFNRYSLVKMQDTWRDTPQKSAS